MHMNIMGMLRRRKFRALVRTQLALFEADHGVDVARAREAASEAFRSGDVGAGIDHYAASDDLSEDLQDALETMVDTYAAALDEAVARDYVREFERQAKAAYGDVVPRLQFPHWD